MSLYYITGQAGTGKSAVCQKLRERGLEAHDSDENMARWINKDTGYIHPKSSVRPEQRDARFLASHDWKIPRSSVAELAAQSGNKIIFLCGVGGNEPEIIDFFRASFALVIDDETMKRRLLNRTTNDWGKQPHELEMTLGWQKQALRDYSKYGHIIVDATQSLNIVVDSILHKVEQIENS